MAKKIVLIATALLAPITLLIFLLPVFRMDFLKDRVIHAVEARFNVKMEIGRLNLVWQSGPVLEAHDLRFKPIGADQSLLEVSTVSMRFRIFAMLRKELDVTGVEMVSPNIHALRSADGRWNFEGLLRGTGSSGKFKIDNLRIRDGRMTYTAPNGSAATLRNLDARLTWTGPSHNTHFEARMDVLESTLQNLELSGDLMWGKGGMEGAEARLRMIFDEVDWTHLLAMRPGLSWLPLAGDAVDGFLEGNIKIASSEDGALRLTATGHLTASRVQTQAFTEPFKSVNAALLWDGEHLEVRQGRAAWGAGRVTFEADATGLSDFPRFSVKGGLRNVEFHDLMPPVSERRWEIYGGLNADAEVMFQGRDRQSVAATMTGRGQLEFANGAIRGLNMLGIVANKASRSPFLGYDIRGVLSPNFAALLSQSDMRVLLAQSRFSIGGGNVKVDELNFVSDEFQVSGSGYVSLVGHLKLDCAFALSSAMTADVSRAIPDVAALVDAHERAVLPFSIAGDIVHPALVLDRDYIIGRVIAGRGQRLIQNVLDRGTNAAGDAGSTAGNLLKNVF